MAERWIRDHFGDEVRPRSAFMEELGSELARSWPAPAPEPEPEPAVSLPQPAESIDVWAALSSEPDGNADAALPTRAAIHETGGRRGAWLAVGALVIAVLVGAVYVSTRNKEDSTVAAGTSQPSQTIAAGQTIAPGETGSNSVVAVAADPTSSSAASTQTTAYPTFDPACVETVTGAKRPTIDEAAANSLSDLSSTATLTVNLPTYQDSDGTSQDPYVTTVRVPGGLVFAITNGGDAGGPVTATMVVAVGVDGAVWWVRCLPASRVASLDYSTASNNVVVEPSFSGPWFSLSLVDGTIGAAAATSPPDVPSWDRGPSSLRHGRSADDSGDVIVGVDAAGNEVWRDETLRLLNVEGFEFGTISGVGLAWGCLEGPAVECVTRGLRAYDQSDGRVLWTEEGVRPEFGSNGRAIVSTNDGYRMLSLSDGAFIDGQDWPQGTFASECCLSSDLHFNQLQGGVVVNTNYATVTVWYPYSLGLGSHQISLP